MLLRSALVVLLLAGCQEKNSLYCEGHPDDTANCPRPDANGCTSDDQCTGQVCNTTTSTCVQCTTANPGACTGTTPVCGADNACRSCVAHTDCASNACAPDGSCANEANVAYVDPTGTDNTTCSKAMPCTIVAKALGTGRRFIKLHGTTNEQVSINNQTVTLLADPGAKLTSTTAGVILKVDGSSVVAIYDLEVSDGLGSGGIGISMPAGNTAILMLGRAKIVRNGGGGISIAAGDFDIANCVISMNGGATSVLGGIKIDGIAAAGVHRLDFNTISANVGAASVDTGVSCGTVVTPLTFENNIIYANSVSSGGKQVGGSSNCAVAYSDVGPDDLAGTGNLNVDPLFVNGPGGNFHLMGNSPVKDMADPAATLEADFDGNARPQGNGRDMGADEIMP